VIYALQFYWVDEAGRQEALARQWQQAKSLAVAEARARATLKNVLLGSRRANLCVVKDAKGAMVAAVVGSCDKAPRSAARHAAHTDPVAT
jgi:hypothetical protein